MKTIKVLPLAILGVVVGIVISVILIFTRTLPVQASAEAAGIDNLYIFFLGFSGIIFGIVVLFLLVSVFRFRARPNDEREGDNVHGITWLEVVWTVIPFVIVVLCAIGGLIVLRSGDVEAQARTKGQQIHVLGYQFGWKYAYLNQDIDLKDQQTLVLPVNEPVIFELESNDVIHSFWVPAWRMQMNATPGQVNETSTTPTKIGTFEVVCAYLCGVGHTGMNTSLPGSIIPKVQVVSKSDFDAWITQQKAEAAKAAESSSAETTTGSAG
ncbi:MAG: cytochrome c oxidase subunit II [Actinobacteria bacterium]|nr:cytochrome c oxidase subunit II [Actinomycetota bacterium]